MAYVFGFPKDITNLIYSMRDWRLEQIKQRGGTPSRLALLPFEINSQTADQLLMDMYGMVSTIEVRWLGNYALDDGVTPLSGEDDEHWIRGSDPDEYNRWRNWNYYGLQL